MATRRLSFASDYQEGCHPLILGRLAETNLVKTPGYGLDGFSESARDKIRKACSAPDAEVFFLSGGTQANAIIINSLLRDHQGVLAPETGHICSHEAGAVERGGSKILTLPQKEGKVSSSDIEKAADRYSSDDNRSHMVMPGMLYISQPTEYGTLYSLKELEAISRVCRDRGLYLYIDGARLAYAFGSPANDVSLPDLAALADVFYIGGTKCGALMGEAAVIPKPGLIPHFFTIIKQRGALLAKGRLPGIQFDVLFTDNLYLEIGRSAVKKAQLIQDALRAKHRLYLESPTNQVFAVLSDPERRRIEEAVDISFWERLDDEHSAVRFATSWATSDEDVDELLRILDHSFTAPLVSPAIK